MGWNRVGRKVKVGKVKGLGCNSIEREELGWNRRSFRQGLKLEKESKRVEDDCGERIRWGLWMERKGIETGLGGEVSIRGGNGEA
mgnify:CR=1 FL=1